MYVEVLDPVTNRQIFTCTGPDLNGGCEREPASDQLPCQGHLLQTRSAPGLLDGFRFLVSGSSPACPLRCFTLGQT